MESKQADFPVRTPAEREAEIDPHQIALQAVATWRNVYAALAPIIGHRGVSALYQRSVHLTCPEFPWLGAVYAAALDSGDFGALRSALWQQSNAAGTAANQALLTTFCDLLGQLIGESLTARLLGNVWNETLAGNDRD